MPDTSAPTSGALVHGSIRELSALRAAAVHLRSAAQCLRVAGCANAADERDVEAHEIERTSMAVTVPCLLCRGGFPVVVLVGSTVRPSSVLCEDCDRRTTQTALRRHPAADIPKDTHDA